MGNSVLLKKMYSVFIEAKFKIFSNTKNTNQNHHFVFFFSFFYKILQKNFAQKINANTYIHGVNLAIHVS